jgi:hypothetical protein
MSQSQSPTRNKVAAQTAFRRKRPTTERGPRFGVVGSVLFHGLIFAAVLFTFQRNFDTPQDSNVVPVDLVTIADKTNVAAQAPPTPLAPEKMDIPPSPLTPPPEPDMQDVEPAPVPPVPDFKIAKEKPVVEKPLVETKKQQQQDFNDLLTKLTTPDKPAKTAKAGPRVVQAVGLGNAMAANLADIMRSAIRPCWSPNAVVAPNPTDMIVNFDLALNPDGSVGSLALTRESQIKAASNPYTQASAAAASRAIYGCQPYRLPPNQFNLWHETTLNFDPRQMMEQ